MPASAPPCYFAPDMTTASLPILDFVLRNYRNFISRATRDALISSG